MTIADLEHFKQLLLEREQNVLNWLDSPTTPNEEDVSKAQALLVDIKDALDRVEKQDYGACEVCKGDIELYRLEIQPVTEICLGCISNEERAQLEEELFLASKIHRALLPQTVQKIDGYKLAVRSIAARIVGGDYFDFLPSAGGNNRIVIADTMGKGIPAGLLMSNVQGALRILAEDIMSPCQLILKLNQWLCRNIPVTKFISLACILLENDTENWGKITFTNAGHCPGILIRRDGTVETLEPTGGVLGVHPGFTYEEKKIPINSGDLLLLYTDGVTESENENGEMYGDKKLTDFIKRGSANSPEQIVEDIIAEIKLYSGSKYLADDLTIMAIQKI